MPSWLVNFGWWYLAGALCSLVWPLVYRKGMRGHWPSFFKQWPVLSIFGPLALIAAFPM